MNPDDQPWVDILTRKHECGPSLSPYISRTFPTEGGTINLWMPDEFERTDRFEIKAVIGSGPLISVVGSYPSDDDFPEGRVVLMVARRSDDDSYVVHVWHELYPWALKYLGLSEEGANP